MLPHWVLMAILKLSHDYIIGRGYTDPYEVSKFRPVVHEKWNFENKPFRILNYTLMAIMFNQGKPKVDPL